MMFDESATISANTWTRAVENISKVGYSDGVVDGESNSFQTSFNMGYSQGLQFGLKLGYESTIPQKTECRNSRKLLDPCNINCQICIDKIGMHNVMNLYNIQEEKNYRCLKNGLF